MRLNSSILTEEANPVFIDVESVIRHPLYEKDIVYFDAGVVIGKTPIIYSTTMRPICLPVFPVDSEDYLPGHEVTMTGFGKIFISPKETSQSTQLKFLSSKVQLKY